MAVPDYRVWFVLHTVCKTSEGVQGRVSNAGNETKAFAEKADTPGDCIGANHALWSLLERERSAAHFQLPRADLNALEWVCVSSCASDAPWKISVSECKDTFWSR